MSVVNKMLRDLDARRVGENDRAALPAAVTPLAAHQAETGNRLRPLLGIGLVAIAGAAAWYGTRPSEPTTPAPPVTAERATAAPPPTAQDAVTPPVTTQAAATPPPTAPPSAESPASPPTPPVQPAADAPLPAARVIASPGLRMDEQLHTVAPPAAASMQKPPAAAVTTSTERPSPAVAAPAKPKSAETLQKVAEPVPKAVAVALPKMPQPALETRIDKQTRQPSATERAETEYRRGLQAQRQGNADEAAGAYRATLEDAPDHVAARLALAALLIEAKRFDEADELLSKGIGLPQARLASTLALARLKVERNQIPAALDLLQKNAPSGERSAEYQGFTGALLNRAGRPAESVEHYQAATRIAPGEARWWAGLGIALDAAGKSADAREAYQKARSLPGLPADLAQHVEQRLR